VTPLYRRAQGGEGTDLRTKAKGSSPGRGMGSGGATCVGAGQGTAARPEVRRRGGDAWRARKGGAGRCGTSGNGHSARAGRPRPVSACGTAAVQCATRDTARNVARVGANAWRWRPAAFDMSLFNYVLLQMFQQKWAE
jgi:hypothetical protein